MTPPNETSGYVNLIQQLIQTNHVGKLQKSSGEPDEDFKSWFEEFQAATEKKGLPEKEQITLLKSKLKENIRVFARILQGKVARAFPMIPSAAAEVATISYFIRAVGQDLGSKIASRNPETLNQAIDFAVRYDTAEPKTQKKTNVSGKLNLQILSEEATDDAANLNPGESTIKSDVVNKRNGGTQQITICSLIEQIKNNNKQTCQQISDLKKQIQTDKKESRQNLQRSNQYQIHVSL